MPEKHDRRRLRILFRRYLADRISEEEFLELWKLMAGERGKDIVSDELRLLWESRLPEHRPVASQEWDEKMQALISRFETLDPPKGTASKMRLWKWAAAVAVVLLVATGVLIYQRRLVAPNPVAVHNSQPETQGIPPGSNKAVLILSNGSRIDLDSSASGVITKQGETNIVKPGRGQLAYNTTDSHPENTVYNMLSIPRGGKYQVTLPDRTKVWLNAASTLRFPTAFAGDSRVVEMTGEAYFEVQANATKPFIVMVDGMRVKVLGTHFNVMAYDDEPVIRTTLLEGAVKVEKGKETVALKPGQQARMDKKGQIQVVEDPNAVDVVAWKNGLFWFQDNTIQEVMRKLSRWYDADVEIKGKIAHHFTGSIPRDVNILRVFEVLKETGNIHFKVEDHKIIVTP